VTLRQQLATEDDVTLRELANSQLLCGQLMVQAGQIDEGARHMADALQLSVELPDADDLTERAIAAVHTCNDQHPGIFAHMDIDPWLPLD
jgi:hypothetical protein